ncbi:baseplate hub + tail lysozyme [Synechococcus phage S-CAM3]|uniref:Baseplate hub + tail lysozyme n=1 Tax=Synechococcus phage S-CAM3 TaxID=1883366 RepID=A0A1D8KIR0_9CAUD|nr:baseplate hub subunit and tail lysozyme [Synechococcus phage S-CAM3]AOV58517.1 baseplate hub + tail lysozyme [Synechococcus phage S-CAM3]AOV58756.1 baseplate hub + tail lysozyme [Synechococcus phage S-CAM3]AOV58995.1 baseplate hub + tail lysozyme [Synechococcus phage S-CAM3]
MQTNQVGDDGFHWWIGQVETSPTDDPKKSGRYRVRIIGHNLKDTTPTTELPWAQVMLPVTTPFSDGGVTGATANLRAGNWVTGFFLDNDRQKPIIMGSIGHTAGATEVKLDQPQEGEGQAFTTYTDPDSKPQAHRSMKNQDGTDPDTGANVDGGEPDAAQAHEENGAPAIIAALRGKHSEANPIGSKACVTIANPTCGTESNFSKQLTNIVGDMLAANQSSGGQLGSYYVSQINGFLYDKVEIARYHIGRVTRLVRSLVGRVQSEIIRNIRTGIEDLVKAALGLNVPEEEKEKVPVDPKADFDTVRPKGNVLKTIKKVLDQILEALGCAIEDLIDKLVQFLTDLLFDFIMDIFSPAACAVTNLIDGIINEILGLIDGLIAQILGPIQSILSLIGGSVDIVSSAISKVMSFLGITCSGPSGKCSEETVKCNDCGTDEDEEDFLDNLLKDIEEGDTGERLDCPESLDYSDAPATKVIFVGGVPSWDPPSIPKDGSKPPGTLDPKVIIPPNFSPSTADDPSNDPNIIPQFPPGGGGGDDDDFFSGGPSPTPDGIIPTDEEIEEIFGPDDDDDDLPRDPDGGRYYVVTANPTLVTEGDTITYTIKTANVPIGTMLKYRLSGDTILPEYIVGGSLTGEYPISEIETVFEDAVDEDGNLISVPIPLGIATVRIQLADDDVLTSNYQEMLFTVVDENDTDTPATALVRITYDAYSLVNPNYNPDVAPTESVSVQADKELYYEGEDIFYTITSQNIPDGTRLEYIIYGDISPDDFVQDSLSGSFVINNNTAKVTVGIVEDLDEERDERAYFKVIGYDATEEITIVGTLVEEEVTEEPTRNELDKPRASAPITDDRGSIITIPVAEIGDRYLEAPKVIISSGQGFGATAIALLDDKGYVTEIRVTKPGLGYKINTPEGNGLECIIDSFTLIAPGIKYKTPPTVYIDGKEGIAQAIIDDRGFLISVQILDRTIKYTKTPKVRIIGGGGSGAIVLPNMICLDPEDLAVRGAVKIGTGKYIDCP